MAFAPSTVPVTTGTDCRVDYASVRGWIEVWRLSVRGPVRTAHGPVDVCVAANAAAVAAAPDARFHPVTRATWGAPLLEEEIAMLDVRDITKIYQRELETRA